MFALSSFPYRDTKNNHKKFPTNKKTKHEHVTLKILLQCTQPKLQETPNKEIHNSQTDTNVSNIVEKFCQKFDADQLKRAKIQKVTYFDVPRFHLYYHYL